jgi:ribosomal protein S8
MNFRISIKQVLARIRVAEKKKDLKVIVVFKKELIPFLLALRLEGAIYKFTVQKKTITLCLKKKKIARCRQKEKVLRDFYIAAALYRNPTTLVFLSTTCGVFTKSSFAAKYKKKVGGVQLFVTT